MSMFPGVQELLDQLAEASNHASKKFAEQMQAAFDEFTRAQVGIFEHIAAAFTLPPEFEENPPPLTEEEEQLFEKVVRKSWNKVNPPKEDTCDG